MQFWKAMKQRWPVKNTNFTVRRTFSCPPRHRQLDLLLDADASLLRTDFSGKSACGFCRQSQAGVTPGRGEEELLHHRRIRAEGKVSSAAARRCIRLPLSRSGGSFCRVWRWGGRGYRWGVRCLCSHFLLWAPTVRFYDPSEQQFYPVTIYLIR